MPIEMAADKLVDFGFGRRMKVLELVHSLEFDYVEAVRQNPIWLPLQKMLAFICCDMGDGCEDVRAMCRRAFDAVAVIDPSLPGFMVNIKVLEVVVEVDGTRAEIATKESCVGRKNSRYVDVPLPA